MAEREALAAVVPVDPGRDYDDAQVRVRRLERQLAELDRGEGQGVWRDTLPRLERLDHQIATAAYEMDLERGDLDSIAPVPPPTPPEPDHVGPELRLGLGGPDIGLGL